MHGSGDTTPTSILVGGTARLGQALPALLAAGAAALLWAAPSSAAALTAMALLIAGLAAGPLFGLPLLAAVLPFHLMPVKLGPMAFSMPELVLLGGVGGAALHVAWRRHRGERMDLWALATPLDRPVALFLGAALLSLLASEVLRVSLRDLRTLVLEPVLAYYLASSLLRERVRRSLLVLGLLVGGVAAAGLGLYQFLFTDQVVAVEGSRRVLGPYLSPNQLGLYLGRLVPLALAAVAFVPRARLLGAPALGLLVVVQVLTFSVGAWLATLLAAGTVLLLWRPRAILALAAAVGALVALAMPLLSMERISSHLSLTRGTSFIRIHLWGAAVQMVSDHPLLGVGMDNFLYHYRTYYLLPEAAAEPNLSHPHNLVLNLWLQMGLLGVVAALWLTAELVRLSLRLWRSPLSMTDRGLLAGAAGAGVDMVAHGLVDNSYFLVDLAFLYWLLAGALVCLVRSPGGSSVGACLRRGATPHVASEASSDAT